MPASRGRSERNDHLNKEVDSQANDYRLGNSDFTTLAVDNVKVRGDENVHADRPRMHGPSTGLRFSGRLDSPTVNLIPLPSVDLRYTGGVDSPTRKSKPVIHSMPVTIKGASKKKRKLSEDPYGMFSRLKYLSLATILAFFPGNLQQQFSREIQCRK